MRRGRGVDGRLLDPARFRLSGSSGVARLWLRERPPGQLRSRWRYWSGRCWQVEQDARTAQLAVLEEADHAILAVVARGAAHFAAAQPADRLTEQFATHLGHLRQV